MNEKILNILHDNFINIHGELSTEELNDRLYIEIQNDKQLLSFTDDKTPAGIWYAIQRATINLFFCILEYNEITVPLTNRNFTHVKAYFEKVFGRYFYEIAQPTFDYYYKERY